MPLLIIPLPAEMPLDGREWDFVQSVDGVTIQRHGSVAADRLVTGGSGQDTVALIPVSALSWHRVVLPAKVRPSTLHPRSGTVQLRAVLEGLLEEQVLEETAHLHFAVIPARDEEHGIWVAACKRDWLRAHIQHLQAHGCAINRIVAEMEPPTGGRLTGVSSDGPVDATSALAHASASLSFVQRPSAARVVRVSAQGVVDLPATAAAVQWLGCDDATTLTAEPGLSELAESLCERTPTLQSAPQRWLAAAGSRHNLAQFDLAYLARNPLARRVVLAAKSWYHEPRWRVSRWLAAALVLVHVAALNAYAWKEHRLLAEEQDQLGSILRTSFPGVPVVVDAPLQMERELDLLRQTSGVAGPRDLSTMLDALAGAANAASLPAPSGIDFSGDGLRLSGLNLKPEAADALRARLHDAGYEFSAEGSQWLVRSGVQP